MTELSRTIPSENLPEPGDRYREDRTSDWLGGHKLLVQRGQEPETQAELPWQGMIERSQSGDEPHRERPDNIPPPISVACDLYNNNRDSGNDCTCYLEPGWVSPRGFQLDQDDLVMVYRSPGYGAYSWCGSGTGVDFRPQDYRYSVVWGSGSEWRQVVLDGEARHVPQLSHMGSEVTVCVPEGFYVVDTDRGVGSDLEPWPRRLSLSGITRPPLMVALLMLSVLLGWLLLGEIRTRRTTSKIRKAQVQDATVTYLTDEGLTVSTSEGETLSILWTQLIDVFRAEKTIFVAWSDEAVKLAVAKPQMFHERWQRPAMQTGQRIKLVLDVPVKGSGPYRSGHSSHESNAWLLHDDITLRQTLSGLKRSTLNYAFSWLLVFASFAAMLVSAIW
jgi:hypothetical protein